eukprot:1087183-Pyramimonas_sp.AAC.1
MRRVLVPQIDLETVRAEVHNELVVRVHPLGDVDGSCQRPAGDHPYHWWAAGRPKGDRLLVRVGLLCFDAHQGAAEGAQDPVLEDPSSVLGHRCLHLARVNDGVASQHALAARTPDVDPDAALPVTPLADLIPLLARAVGEALFNALAITI